MNQRRGGFTLVEIMIVVAIIALLAAIAVPGFLRARKRSQATTVLNNLRLIDAAKEQYATEYNKTDLDPTTDDLAKYFKDNSQLQNMCAGNPQGFRVQDPKFELVMYYFNSLGALPSVDAASSFSDVTDSTFWSPYSAGSAIP